MDPDAKIERCSSFKLPRHRARRGRTCMVTSLQPNLVASSSAPHRMAPVGNVAVPSHMVRLFDVAALLASGLGVRATVL
jgi:hypothetical protein